MGRLGSRGADIDGVRFGQGRPPAQIDEGQASVLRPDIAHAAMLDHGPQGAVEGDGGLQMEAAVGAWNAVCSRVRAAALFQDVADDAAERGIEIGVGPEAGQVIVLAARAEVRREAFAVNPDLLVALAPPGVAHGLDDAGQPAGSRALKEQPILAIDGLAGVIKGREIRARVLGRLVPADADPGFDGSEPMR